MSEIIGSGAIVAGRGNVTAVGRVYSTGNPAMQDHSRMQDVATRSEPKFTGMGFEIAKTFTVNESEPIDGALREYELLVDNEVTWTSIGDDRADALLEAIAQVTDQGDELPDN
jgi:hypothetical protein